MPRNVGKDKSIDRVDAAARAASAKGSGTAGGSLKQVNFAPGTSEMYKKGKK
jgi:hypothetical protein